MLVECTGILLDVTTVAYEVFRDTLEVSIKVREEAWPMGATTEAND